jgi:hypothetical protein
VNVRMRRIGLVALLAFMIISMVVGFVMSLGAKGATGISVTASNASVNFPSSITFTVKATSDQPITDIRLLYTVAQRSLVTVINEGYVVFNPATSVNANWVWDMRQNGGLPPGTGITYWWKITDASGGVLETDKSTFTYQDQRYSWHSLTQGLVTLYWYNGDNNFAAQLMNAAQSAMTHLSDIAGAELTDPVKLYIYKDAQDLQGALVFSQDWTGGVAFSQYSTVAIGIGTSASELAWGETTIAHELTHVIVGQVTENPYGDLPTWLNEGLAMVAEGPLDSSFTSVFQQALSQHTLISVRSLASPFSVFGNIAYLDYAESDEITNYLLTTYGRDKMLQLLHVFAQGSTYDNALQQVYGFDMDGLNSQWQASLGYGTGT